MISENTNKSDKIVADIFGAELIMGMTTRVSTVGGDWANAPNPGQVMSDTEMIYTTDDTEQAYDLVKKYDSSVFLGCGIMLVSCVGGRCVCRPYGRREWKWLEALKHKNPRKHETIFSFTKALQSLCHG